MRLNLRSLFTIAVLSLLACSSPDRNPPLGAPEITTADLGHAHLTTEFRVVLAATAAETPVSWTFAVAPPPALSWLTLSTDGILAGTPPALGRGGDITVRATDAGGRWTDKTFTIVVDLCADGDQTTCSFASTGACTVGTTTCANGTYGTCVGGLSTVANACGADGTGTGCGSCGPTADSCVGGATCQCGADLPCSGTNAATATCTGGACVNACNAGWGDCDSNGQNGCERSMRTNTDCGACNVPCTPWTYGLASCSTGTCQQSCPSGRVPSGSTCVCSAGLTECPGPGGACVNTSTSALNCGTCGNVCTAGANREPYCASGVCYTRCATGYESCNGFCVPVGDCIPTCFVAGTPVTLADGSTKPIEEIVGGDRVLAMDTTTRTLTGATVAHPIFHPTAPVLLRINGRITTTPEHRFFVDGGWRNAIELKIGDVLVTAGAGGSAGTEIVTQLELLDGNVPVYNLEVEGLHDYFAGGVLVHNAKQVP